jgi:hypothetical protein
MSGRKGTQDSARNPLPSHRDPVASLVSGRWGVATNDGADDPLSEATDTSSQRTNSALQAAMQGQGACSPSTAYQTPSSASTVSLGRKPGAISDHLTIPQTPAKSQLSVEPFSDSGSALRTRDPGTASPSLGHDDVHTPYSTLGKELNWLEPLVAGARHEVKLFQEALSASNFGHSPPHTCLASVEELIGAQRPNRVGEVAPYKVGKVVVGGVKCVVKSNVYACGDAELRRAALWEPLVVATLSKAIPSSVPKTYCIIVSDRELQTVQLQYAFSLQQYVHRKRLVQTQSIDAVEYDIVRIAYRFAMILQKLHSFEKPLGDTAETIVRVVHGNVRPESVLVQNDGKEVALCGWSHSVMSVKAADGSVRTCFARQPDDDPAYVAPEVAQAESENEALRVLTDRADVWGFALTILNLITGAPSALILL